MSDFLSGVKLVVSDFDGVFTDMRAIHEPYLSHNRGHLERLLADRLGPDEVAAALNAALDQVAKNPHLYGWRVGDYIVAPAGSDPYIWIRSAVTLMLDGLKVFEGTDERDAFQENVFKDFEKVPVPLKSEARAYLEWLDSEVFFSVIVSNSSTGPVRGRLEGELQAVLRERSGVVKAFGPSYSGQRATIAACEIFVRVTKSLRRFLDMDLVVGGAKKYYVASAEQVQNFVGLDRPVHLDRPHYRQLLSRLLRGMRRGTGASWSELLVVGDIFELDLVMPLAMGAKVVLVDNGTNVMPWERAFLQDHERARIVTDITKIPSL